MLSRSRLCSGSRNATGARGTRVANGVPMERGVCDVREKARVRRGREKARAAKASIIVWTVDGRNAEGRLCFSDERRFRERPFCEHKIQVPFALNRPISSSSCAQNTHQVSPARAFAPRARDFVSGGDALRPAMRRRARVAGRATHARTRRHRRGPAEPSSMNAKHYAHRGTLKARPRVHGSDGARCLSKPISSALLMLPSVP